MKNSIFKKGLVIGIILLFVGASVVPSIGGNVENKNETPIRCSTFSSNTDWWPMFQHDEANSCFSKSSIPNNLNIIWSKSFKDDLNISFDSNFNSLLVANNRVFVTGMDRTDGYSISNITICAFNESDGSLNWKQDIAGPGKFLPAVTDYNTPAVINGKVFIQFTVLFPKFIGKIVELEETTGDIILEKKYLSSGSWGSVVVTDNKIIAGGYFIHNFPISRISIFNETNGKLIWRKLIFGLIESTPIVSGNELYVITSRSAMINIFSGLSINSRKSTIFAFNLDNGKQLWIKKGINGHVIYSSPTAAYEKIFVPSNLFKNDNSCDRRITAYDKYDGTEIWYFQINGSPNIWAFPTCISSPSVGYGKIFVTDLDGSIIALNESDGTIIWKRKICDFSFTNLFISPIVADKKVIVAASDSSGGPGSQSKICMFNESNGELIWESSETILGYIESLVVANNKLFIKLKIWDEGSYYKICALG